MSAGTFQLVELKRVDHGIIVFLRINVANISRYGYHEFACVDAAREGSIDAVGDSRQTFPG